MKNITKDNKGITLIALIVTIIVMLIVASVATYTGIDTYKYSQVNKFVTQMQLLQAKVDNLVEEKTEEELNNMGLLNVTTQEQINAITTAFKQDEISNANTSMYKVFTKDKVLEILDVEDVQNDIMVNFVTREIVSLEGVEHEGTTYYTQYKLPGGQTIVNNTSTTTRELKFTLEQSIDGLNATILIDNIEIANGTLSYKEQNSTYWTTITNYTENEKEYTANISKNGNYTFRLHDNVDSENYIEKSISIKLANKPKTQIELEEYNYALSSEKWAYSEKDNINYVWIPRFAYKTNLETGDIEIKFIKGNSNIATDNTYIDDTWNIDDKFTVNGIEVTGLWVSIQNANQSGVDMVALLQDDTRTTLIEI